MIYVILGQTASGKTSLALKLAREFSLPIISADAFQCYKMMTIGTDKPTREEVGDLEYLFYDRYEPDQPISVFDFQKEMREKLDQYQKEGRDVLVVGGTFLYIKALLYPYSFTEEKEDHSLDDLPLEELQQMLLKLDKKTYEQIDNQNSRRVIRAIRQAQRGRSREEILKENDGKTLYPSTFVRIDIDKEEGNKKIDQRVEEMFDKGLVEEIQTLLKKYPSDIRPFSSIGYREVIEALLKGRKIDQSVRDLVKIHTHQYAKKQRTFLTHQFKDVYSGTKEEIYTYLKEKIEKMEGEYE